MRTRKERFISLLLTLAMVIGLMSGMTVTVFSEPVELTADVQTNVQDQLSYSDEGNNFTVVAGNGAEADPDGITAVYGITITATNGATITKVDIHCGYTGGDSAEFNASPGNIENIFSGSMTVNNVNASSLVFTCSDEDYYFDRFTITYSIDKVDVSGLSLNKDSTSLYIGATEKLTANVSPATATYKTVTWSSSDESVATVNSVGVVTGVASGSAIITATANNGTQDDPSDDKDDTCEVTVSPRLVSSVSLNKDSTSIFQNASEQLTANVSPATASYKTLIWSSSDESVATVNSDGVITAHAAGNATITVTANNGTPDDPSDDVTDTCDVTVHVFMNSGTYIDENGQEQEAPSYTLITNQTEWSSGWYVVDSNTTISGNVRVIRENTVNLIINDDKTLTINGCINTNNATLNIYGQSKSNGKLNANAANTSDAAGIGGGAERETAGTLTINGGVVTATGGYCAAGIGGGKYAANGQLTINGGTVTATGGKYAAGIGGGNDGHGGTIIINGGTVTATGGDSAAGIGGGNNGNGKGGTITINGGLVTATGASNADAIGGGRDNRNNGTITLGNVSVRAGSNSNSYSKVAKDAFVGSHRYSWAQVFTANQLPASITVNPASLSLDVHGTSQLSYVFDQEFAEDDITWTSSDETIATVDETGLVTAVKEGGPVTITATTSTAGLTSNCQVTVNRVDVSGISLNSDSISVTQLDAVTLTAIISPETASYKYVKWSVGGTDPDAVKIYSDPECTAEVGTSTTSALTVYAKGVSAGQAAVNVTATNGTDGNDADDMIASCAVTATMGVTAVELSDALDQMLIDEKATFSAIITPGEATDKTISWTSSDEAVATVDENGMVTAVGGGTTTISAIAANGVSTSHSLTVIVPVSGITLSKVSAEVPLNNVLTLVATISPDAASNKNVSWESSDEAVATVDENGVVRPHVVGTATITAISVYDSSISTSCAITVLDAIDSSEYTIVIPEELTVQSSGWNEAGEFSVTGVLVNSDDGQSQQVDTLNISASSINSSKLKLQNGDATINYSLKETASGAAVNSWTFGPDDLPAAMTLGIVIDDYSNMPVGTYTDTISFDTSLTTVTRANGETVSTVTSPGSVTYTLEIELVIGADPDVTYSIWADGAMDEVTLSEVRYTVVDANTTAWDGSFRDGYHIVNEDITIDGNVTVSGDVKLILCNNATLTVNGNISGGNLSVYHESGKSGALAVTGSISSTTLTFDDCTVTAGSVNANTAVRSNGGSLNVSGAIGGGTIAFKDCTVTAAGISGTTVSVIGSELTAESNSGNAISGNVTITESLVIARAASGYKGIAGGTLSVSSDLSVYGDDENPNTTTIQEDYASSANRWRYMIVQTASRTQGIYYDENFEEQVCDEYTFVNARSTELSEGWYLVDKDVTINLPVTANGTVNLILNDGVTLNVSKGISIENGGVLNIYGQYCGTGELSVTGNNGTAVSGNVNFYGGRVSLSGTGDGAGLDGSLTVNRGTFDAKGSGSGVGINGSITINKGVVNAEGSVGVNGGTVTVINGGLNATGNEKGIIGTISIGGDRMVQGGADSSVVAPITNYNNESARTPYMLIAESVFTVFYSDDLGWKVPCLSYSYAGGSESLEMTRDGSMWRATIDHLPTEISFFDAVVEETTDTEETQQGNEAIVAGDSTGAQSGFDVYTIDAENPAEPQATVINGYGSFFVVTGGCRSVTFVDGENVLYTVMIPDGGVPERPDGSLLQQREGYHFSKWVYNGNTKYNFTPLRSSLVLYASFDRDRYRITYDLNEWMGKYWLTRVSDPFRKNTGEKLTENMLEGPTKKYPQDVFQGWYLSGNARVYNYETGFIETVEAGELWDFENYGVVSDIHLKPRWQHEHDNEMLQYSAYYERTTGEQWRFVLDSYKIGMNNSVHVLMCDSCKNSYFEAHSYDANGVCACGFNKSDVLAVYPVNFVASDENGRTQISRTERPDGSYAAFPLFVGEGVFMSYQVYDVSDPNNPVLKKIEYNQNMSAFTISYPTEIVKVHRNRFVVNPVSWVELKTSKASGDNANLKINWSLSTGCNFVSAGVLTTTNAELQKYGYSSFGGTKTVDPSNLLKSNQRWGSYDTDLRDSMKSMMMNGDSYNPVVPAVIHDFRVNYKASSGSYLVPHQLPTGTAADKYGPWVYAIGYVNYYDTTGVLRRLYTKPVALSVSDAAHTEKYTRGDVI